MTEKWWRYGRTIESVDAPAGQLGALIDSVDQINQGILKMANELAAAMETMRQVVAAAAAASSSAVTLIHNLAAAPVPVDTSADAAALAALAAQLQQSTAALAAAVAGTSAAPAPAPPAPAPTGGETPDTGFSSRAALDAWIAATGAMSQAVMLDGASLRTGFGPGISFVTDATGRIVLGQIEAVPIGSE